MQDAFEKTLRQWLGVPEQSLVEVKSFFRPSRLEKDEFFLKTGRFSDKMAYIQSGIVREYFIDDQGREVTKWISTPGYFLLDIAGFLFRQPARWNLQALSDCELLTISWDDYRRLGQQTPLWPELEKMFLAKCFTVLENRIAAHLSLTSEERYRFFFQQNPELFNQVPLKYLASMLGMTPETFSRIRKKQSRSIS